MSANAHAIPARRGAVRGGWVVTGLTAAFLLMDTVVHLVAPPSAIQATVQLGFAASLVRPLGVIELLCLAAYLLPRSSVLGAVLLTGYLGGATAAKVRLEDPWFLFSVTVGVLVWGGLWLRDARLRALLPFRS